MATTQRRYRREARYSAQLRVTVEPAMAAALEAEADVTHTSVSAVIRDALARGLPLARDARRKRRSGPRNAGARRGPTPRDARAAGHFSVRRQEQRRAGRAMHRAAVQLHQAEPFQVNHRERVKRSLAHVNPQVRIAGRSKHAPAAVEGAPAHARSSSGRHG